ncbi:MAG: helix-turn-helix transcriptional regulator [Clostridia bacterium]|nr:helix-turn-helix transcriptional regulator [Clostridia bacterium]
MFSITEIGMKLAEARKKKDLTQTELADLLGISFQAVSNWERGNSMPDISRLPEIAELLDLPPDELLGCAKPLSDSICDGTVTEYFEREDADIREAVELAPLMKPSQVDEVARTASDKRPLSEINRLLPFLGQDVRDEMFIKAVESGNTRGAAPIVPFVSTKVINQTAARVVKEKGISGIGFMLPFIGNETLVAIADDEFAKNGLRNLERIAPFLPIRKLQKYAEQAIERDGISAISPIAPFLGADFLSKYVREKYL